MIQFPKGFLWGSATCAHQVEGNSTNQWSVWETSQKRQTFLSTNGYIKTYGADMFTSRNACEHAERFEDDVKLMKELGHTCYRFSIEWAKIEPVQGEYDEIEVERYRSMLLLLEQHDIEPMVTLFHFTLPIWFSDMEGFEREENLQYALHYTEKIARELGGHITYWTVINELEPYALNSYLGGMWAPQKKSLWMHHKVRTNLIKYHKKSYDIIHKYHAKSEVGIAKNNVCFDDGTAPWYQKPVLKFLDYLWNKRLLNSIKSQLDFIGINFYFHFDFKQQIFAKPKEHCSDLKWKLRPECLEHILVDLNHYDLPIYITENGIADQNDKLRGWWIHETCKAMDRAIARGVDLRGFMYWSLMDNFEWHEGYLARFGLLEMDFDTQVRTIRSSARFFADISRENGVTDEVLIAHKGCLKLPDTPYCSPVEKTVTESLL
jgi:beta-glucosidase